MLPPAVRAQLAQHAQAELNKQTATDQSNFKTRVEDTLAEAGRNGVAEKPVSQGEFVRALGAKQGLDAYSDYQSDMKLRTDISQVARMTPQQQGELIKSYDPKAGEDGFADQTKRQAALQTAVARARKERDDDPATFAIARIPVVQEAWGTLAGAISDPALPMPAKQAAARDFANKTTAEQQRSGVAPTDVRVLPKGYVESLKARLDNPQESGGTGNVVQQIKNEAALWGDAWPKVYRQIAPEVGPLVRVIGSGVSDTAGRILTELAPQKLGDILKDENVAKANQVRGDVLTAFTPFIKSMAGNEGGISVFNDFRVQGEKLSAYYIVQGMSSADAAAKAFKELIGDRYEFRDSWRAPKGLTVSADDIQRGTVQAMRDLVDIGIAPPRDSIGGLSADYLMKAKADAIRRDGKWVTAPDESGLALIYNDEAVRGTNGKPLILSWSQLGAIADREKRLTADMYSRASGVDDAATFGSTGEGGGRNIVQSTFLGVLSKAEAMGFGGTAVKLYNDVVQRGRTSPITEADIPPSEVADFAKLVRGHADATGKSEGTIDYPDYRKFAPGLSHNIVGGFSYKIGRGGDITITDTYDFNVARAGRHDENVLLQAVAAVVSPRNLASKIGRDTIPDAGGRGIPVQIHIASDRS
jgi:hypothetical protein